MIAVNNRYVLGWRLSNCPSAPRPVGAKLLGVTCFRQKTATSGCRSACIKKKGAPLIGAPN